MEANTSALTPLELRRQEVAQYEANIAIYTAIAEALPSEWPTHLEHLRGAKNTHELIATVEDLNDVTLVSNLWAHDQAQAAIRTETVELAKSRAILAVLEAQAAQ